jgi:hypothetical protein
MTSRHEYVPDHSQMAGDCAICGNTERSPIHLPKQVGPARDLLALLEQKKAEVHEIERRIAAASCATVGHRWKFLGGRNCGCEPNGSCSVPVHECTVCGDCDYGENPEAVEVMDRCHRGPIDHGLG